MSNPADRSRNGQGTVGGGMGAAHRRSLSSSARVAPMSAAAARRISAAAAPADYSTIRLTAQDISEFDKPLVKAQNLRALKAQGGVKEVAHKLGVDIREGVSETAADTQRSVAKRRELFGSNTYAKPSLRTFGQVLGDALLNDVSLIVTLVYALLALIVGSSVADLRAEGFTGLASASVAVMIVVFMRAWNEYAADRAVRALDDASDTVMVSVFRDAKQKRVPLRDVVVGDIVKLETGDRVPADCLYHRGDDVKSDESSLTGEPQELVKDALNDPFLLAGCSVTAGWCRALVVAVGRHSQWGAMAATLARKASPTPLQVALRRATSIWAGAGAVCGLVALVCLLVVWFAEPDATAPLSSDEATWMLNAVLVLAALTVTLSPEGLSLALTLALQHGRRHMSGVKALVRVPAALETMGKVTSLCCDKTGTLTENKMTAVSGWIAGVEFSDREVPPESRFADAAAEVAGRGDGGGDSSSGAARVVVPTLLREGLALNSTVEVAVAEDGTRSLTGSSTEAALVEVLEGWEGFDVDTIRGTAAIKKQYAFTANRKMMSTLVLNADGSHRLYVKGAPEYMLTLSTHAVMSPDGTVEELADDDKEAFTVRLDTMSSDALRVIAIAYRDFAADEALPAKWQSEPPEQDLTYLGLIGIRDPLRPGVPEFVAKCRKSGVFVRMITGDNVNTAKAIARSCGIFTDAGVALTGPEMRRMTPMELDGVLPSLQVLARASPEDKRTLVVRLNGLGLPHDAGTWGEHHEGESWDEDRDRLLPGHRSEWVWNRQTRAARDGEVVAMLGEGANDAAAMKAADVGLCLGISGTEVAKMASDLVMTDDQIAPVLDAILRGRAAFSAVRTFLQYQLAANIVAVLLTIVAPLTLRLPPLNPAMLLFINLVVDAVGAVALSGEAPSAALMQRAPFRRHAPLFTRAMRRNVAAQVVYQAAVLLLLLLGAPSLLGSGQVADSKHVDTLADAGRAGADAEADGGGSGGDGAGVHATLVFNTFVWAQLFGLFSARTLDEGPVAIFRGVHRNIPLVLSFVFVAIAQVVLVEAGSDVMGTAALSGSQWGLSVGLGAGAVGVGALAHAIPMRDNPQDVAVYADTLGGRTAGTATPKRHLEAPEAVTVCW